MDYKVTVKVEGDKTIWSKEQKGRYFEGTSKINRKYLKKVEEALKASLEQVQIELSCSNVG